MKLAIMQPYIFPYIGYFQLVSSVDRFVAYDDVTFIKQGWINRNKILLGGEEYIFTVPLKSASSFVTIGKTELNQKLYETWRGKFYKTLTQAYAKAPHYRTVYDLVSSVFDAHHDTISQLATSSIMHTCSYLGIKTEFVLTATGYENGHLKAEERVLDMCLREKAAAYHNPIGGKELYSKEHFEQHGLALHFIKTDHIAYKQFNNDFVPWLSIIDVMMFNTVEETRDLINAYHLE